MSPIQAQAGRPAWGFPRVSGDEPYTYRVKSENSAFSPRERG